MTVPHETPQATHRIVVDGFTIGEIHIAPGSTQAHRDVIRKDIAREHGCPVHYINLYPLTKARKP